MPVRCHGHVRFFSNLNIMHIKITHVKTNRHIIIFQNSKILLHIIFEVKLHICWIVMYASPCSCHSSCCRLSIRLASPTIIVSPMDYGCSNTCVV
jgi:hypothetical protein